MAIVMSSNLKIKPTPIWPIWIIGFVVIFFGLNSGSRYGSMATGMILFFMIFYSINTHKKNKLYFGKDYKKNPKPVKEAIEKFKKNKYGLSPSQKTITNVLTIGSLIVGFLFAGIFGAVFLGFGSGFLSLSICMFINKTKIYKAIGILFVGMILTSIGIWISYSFLVSAVETVTEKYMEDCDNFCANSEDVDYDLYTQYSVEFDQNTKSFICDCLTDDEKILAQKNLPSK